MLICILMLHNWKYIATVGRAMGEGEYKLLDVDLGPMRYKKYRWEGEAIRIIVT